MILPASRGFGEQQGSLPEEPPPSPGRAGESGPGCLDSPLNEAQCGRSKDWRSPAALPIGRNGL